MKMPAFFPALIIVAQVCCALSGLASDSAVPTLTISREDVVQDSIKQFPFKGVTNDFLLCWDYTAAGTKKVAAFCEAHVGQKVRMRIGSYETPPHLVSTNRPAVAGNIAPGQSLKMQRVQRVNAEDAKAILAALK